MLTPAQNVLFDMGDKWFWKSLCHNGRKHSLPRGHKEIATESRKERAAYQISNLFYDQASGCEPENFRF